MSFPVCVTLSDISYCDQLMKNCSIAFGSFVSGSSGFVDKSELCKFCANFSNEHNVQVGQTV